MYGWSSPTTRHCECLIRRRTTEDDWNRIAQAGDRLGTQLPAHSSEVRQMISILAAMEVFLAFFVSAVGDVRSATLTASLGVGPAVPSGSGSRRPTEPS